MSELRSSVQMLVSYFSVQLRVSDITVVVRNVFEGYDETHHLRFSHRCVNNLNEKSMCLGSTDLTIKHIRENLG